MREDVTERFLAPLFDLKVRVIETLEGNGRAQPPQAPTRSAEAPTDLPPAEPPAQQQLDALAWLRQLDEVGQHLLEPEQRDTREPDLLRAIAAINFQFEALQERVELEPNAPPEIHARLDRLRKAQEMLTEFAAGRAERQAAHRAVVTRPLALSLNTVVFLVVAYIVAYFIAKQFHAGRMYWALPHPGWAKASVGVLMGVLLLLLFLFTALMQYTLAPGPLLDAGTVAWYAGVTVLVAFGVVYPHLLLPPAHQVAQRHPSDAPRDEILSAARRVRRIAYAALMRRYYGIAFGMFAVVFCVWVLGFRIVMGLYPLLEQKLLVTGLQEETLAMIDRVRDVLR